MQRSKLFTTLSGATIGPVSSIIPTVFSLKGMPSREKDDNIAAEITKIKKSTARMAIPEYISLRFIVICAPQSVRFVNINFDLPKVNRDLSKI
jgi:hypothetical protein